MKKISTILCLLVSSSLVSGDDFSPFEGFILAYKGPSVTKPTDDPNTIWHLKLLERVELIQDRLDLSNDEVISLTQGLIERAKKSSSVNEIGLGSRAVHIYAYYSGYSPSALEFVKDLYFNIPNLKLSARVAIGYFPVETAIDAYLEIDSRVDDPVERVNIYDYFSRHTDAIKKHPRSEIIVSTLKDRFKETSAPSSVMTLDKTLAALDPEFKRSAARREKLETTMHSLTERNPPYIRDYFQTQVADLQVGD